MTEEMKLKMFQKVRELETLAGKKTYDGRDYFEQTEGASAMLEIMGLLTEFIRWDGLQDGLEPWWNEEEESA